MPVCEPPRVSTLPPAECDSRYRKHVTAGLILASSILLIGSILILAHKLGHYAAARATRWAPSDSRSALGRTLRIERQQQHACDTDLSQRSSALLTYPDKVAEQLRSLALSEYAISGSNG
jgi:hypothetical protein